MNKQVAKELKIFTNKVCDRYSNNNRANNFNNETFKVQEIIPTSDHTATVIYEKNTGKRAIFFFYYLASSSYSKWNYFVPTDSHLNGMNVIMNQKVEVERYNYKYNFNNEK
jgi:hypothetical protein|tara:strand:- start:159 stop:491 length:333 start_codon:yes stop_codon:yes gene_type:complete